MASQRDYNFSEIVNLRRTQKNIESKRDGSDAQCRRDRARQYDGRAALRRGVL